MTKTPFENFVLDALSETPVATRLKASSAIVLESLARGGGATNWYYCANDKQLDTLSSRLRPGSVVSFYFDERIRQAILSTASRRIVEDYASANVEAMVGFRSPDQLEITASYVCGLDDLADFLRDATDGQQLYYGQFPTRDNDGVDAVTIRLPDLDGVVRPHPI